MVNLFIERVLISSSIVTNVHKCIHELLCSPKFRVTHIYSLTFLQFRRILLDALVPKQQDCGTSYYKLYYLYLSKSCIKCSNFHCGIDELGCCCRIIIDANAGHTYDCLLWALRYAALDLCTTNCF